jgi:ATP-binding cassette subfamily B protein
MLGHYLSRVKSLYQNLTIRKTIILIWTASNYWTALSIFIILFEILLLFYSLFLFKDLVNIVSNLKQSTSLTNDFTFSLLKTAFAGSLYVIATAFSNYIKDVQSSKVSIYVDDKIHKSADEADLAFFESPKYLDVLRRAKDAGIDRPGAIVSSIMEIVKNLLTLGGIAYVMLSISIYLLPLLILFTLPNFLLKIRFAEKVLKWRISQTATERKVGYLSDLITKDTYAKEIKSYNLGNSFREMYTQFRNKLLSEKLSITKRNSLFEVLAMVMAVCCFFTCIFYIVWNNQSSQRNVGDVTIFLVVFSQSFSTMNQLTNSIARVYENNIYLASIFELFENKHTLLKSNNAKRIPSNLDLDLDVSSVNFSYPSGNHYVLKNISFKIPSGKIVALVGTNGSGKSTINKLLNRLYDPASGEIRLGDVNINEFDLVEYRKYVAQVFQDYGKYNFSIASNIHFGKIYSHLNINEVKLAAEKADATSFINAYCDGFETKMGKIFEDGEEISIGQWQKLAIARAFYSDAKLLIFDEATSALDAIAEDKLFTNLRAYLGNKAALIISHRVSAIKHADYIYVINDGEIVQEGNHEALSNIDGAYSSLFNPKKASNNV